MHYPYLRILYLRDLLRGTNEEDLIARPAAVESNSEHPSLKQSSPQPDTVAQPDWQLRILRRLLVEERGARQ